MKFTFNFFRADALWSDFTAGRRFLLRSENSASFCPSQETQPKRCSMWQNVTVCHLQTADNSRQFNVRPCYCYQRFWNNVLNVPTRITFAVNDPPSRSYERTHFKTLQTMNVPVSLYDCLHWQLSEKGNWRRLSVLGYQENENKGNIRNVRSSSARKVVKNTTDYERRFQATDQEHVTWRT